MLRGLLPFLLLAVLFAGAGCRRQARETPAAVETYEASGVVLEVAPDREHARIAHDEIAGYMPAMTMEFSARDPRVLAGVARGDVIRFRLNVTEESGWIDAVQKTGRKDLPAEPAAESGNAAVLPACDLIDQEGNPFRLSERKGEVLALTFIFTRCPYPEFCPRLSRNFAVAQAALANLPNARLVSVTIDPEHDTPERLKAYAQQFGADPARWSFVTGEAAEVRKLCAAAGVSVAAAGALPDHTLRTLVVDGEGRVAKTFAGNEWTAVELAAAMRELAQR